MEESTHCYVILEDNIAPNGRHASEAANPLTVISQGLSENSYKNASPLPSLSKVFRLCLAALLGVFLLRWMLVDSTKNAVESVESVVSDIAAKQHRFVLAHSPNVDQPADDVVVEEGSNMAVDLINSDPASVENTENTENINIARIERLVQEQLNEGNVVGDVQVVEEILLAGEEGKNEEHENEEEVTSNENAVSDSSKVVAENHSANPQINAASPLPQDSPIAAETNAPTPVNQIEMPAPTPVERSAEPSLENESSLDISPEAPLTNESASPSDITPIKADHEMHPPTESDTAKTVVIPPFETLNNKDQPAMLFDSKHPVE